jgi:hypothetical protein
MTFKSVNTEETISNSGKYAMSYACTSCRVSFKRHYPLLPREYPRHDVCNLCGSTTFNLGRHFKPPKKSDSKQWEKVSFLIEHGFYFQKIRPNTNSYEGVPYPETLAEARDFVRKYQKHALRFEEGT